MPEGEPLVIEPREVQDGGVQIVHVADPLHGMDPEFVGRTVRQAPFHPAAGQEDRKAFRVMVATVGAGGVRSASELAGPQNERRFEQAPLLQILNERGDGPVVLPRPGFYSTGDDRSTRGRPAS